MSELLLGFAISLGITFFLVRSAQAHLHLSADLDLSGPQKFHARPVPRVGGIGIFFGTLAALAAWAFHDDAWTVGPVVLVCALPAFLAGLAEDVTKTQSPRRRLFFTAISAGLAVILVGAVIHRTDIPGLDWIMSFGPLAIALTVFAVAGVANAVNIIDGFNGLASMCVVIMLSAIAYVAFQAGDAVVAHCALAVVGAVLGFFVLNYPAGLIFLGDGGAYFLGFFVAEISIVLLNRAPEVSPLFPLLMCIYPIFETVFSIYRRKFIRGRPIGMPDGVHLHSLIYRRMMRWTIGDRSAKVLTKKNSLTAPYLWLLCMQSVVPAAIFWNNSAILAAFIVLFAATYTVLYARIVRFKSPKWLIVRR